MPTVVPEPHKAREAAESFGVDPGRYDRTRPRYPDELITRIVETSPGKEFLNVGIGTGIDARQFRAAGCTLLGVEPDARMADFARQSGFDVEVSTIETWEPAGRTFDAVVAGQAWHWVDPVAGVAKAAEVLRPGGRLAVFWNVATPPPAAGAGFGEVFRRLLPDSVAARAASQTPLDLYATMVSMAADNMRAAGFDEPEEWRYEWQHTYRRDEWLDQLPTQGLFTRLPQDKLTELLAGIGAVIDDLGGSFTMDFTTAAVTATRP